MRARRGSALILVLLMTLAVAGLAIAAIFMSSSAGLLSRFYDREREFRLSAESGIQIARSRLTRDTAMMIPDTGIRQLIAGAQMTDADGVTLPRGRVNVYAAVTGDTSGLFLPHITLVAVSYDDNGTRHVRRVDLERESFSRYALFADSFPSGRTHGPGNVTGRVHTNQMWRGSTFGNSYRDTVTAVTGVSGVGTFDIDSVVGVVPVPYPSDSSFAWMHTLATSANLDVTPVSGGGRGSRVEFVAFDADNNGTVERHEGFVRVFDLASSAGVDTSRLRGSPTVYVASGQRYYRWDAPIIQNQCGAFYLRVGRWHFFPIATHRAAWARPIITATGGSNYPLVSNSRMNRLDDYDYDAVEELLRNVETARCFPAGSPYLMPTERFTNSLGVMTGNAAADTVPFGVVTGTGYGGSDTTFTATVHTCTISATSSPTGRCVAGTRGPLGVWRAFGGTAITGVPASVRQAAELPYLWPYAIARNPHSRGVVSASAGPLYVSGEVRGSVTLRVAGRATLIDRLRYHADPNDPSNAACDDQLGLLATGDVLVVDGLMTRVRRIAAPSGGPREDALLGGETRFTVHGSLMSLTGTVGVENPGIAMGAPSAQRECPDAAGGSTRSNGGCFALTGGAAMRRYSELHAGSTGGYRYFGATDRCQSTDRRPPFFPLTNRYRVIRTLEIEPSQADTPAKIRAILMRLKGRQL